MKFKSLLAALPSLFLSAHSYSSLPAAAQAPQPSAPNPSSVTNPERLSPPPAEESFRVIIHNVLGGEIRGSRDAGKTWVLLGHVTAPANGGIWTPTIGDQVYAFNFLRGPSNVFATAVNAVHLRFSDPLGYQLPTDPKAALVPPHGLSIEPADTISDAHRTTDAGTSTEPTRIISTDIPGGSGIFAPTWTPEVGDAVMVGDGRYFYPIPYDFAPSSRVPERSYILILSNRHHPKIEYVDFENRVNGAVMMKHPGKNPTQIAKVLQPVLGIGRFTGSEVSRSMGVVRANHPGVLDISTTDVALDPTLSMPLTLPEDQLNDLRGGFQIVPSYHATDASMAPDMPGTHWVYMIVGPVKDPSALDRYDQGIDGSYPLFYQGFRAGSCETWFKFKGDDQWYETSNALRSGKFKTASGAVLSHLRGFISDAFTGVTEIRIVNTL